MQNFRFKFFFFAVWITAVSFFSPVPAAATPDYTRQTGFECGHCHVDVIGGGPLTDEGRQFLDDMKSKGLHRSLTMTQHLVRLGIGYIHTLAAIAWFGTILYVHILLKPAYASKGLPRGELSLGWLSIAALSGTGVLLTVARIPSFPMLFSTRFGILLSIKIGLFLVMLLSALIVTMYIGPKLRKARRMAPALEGGLCTPEDLAHFDGKEGRPAYVAYKGVIYDVTASRLWKNGLHAAKHAAGNDLTGVIKNAPHDESRILSMPQAGKLLAAGEKPKQPFHVRLFYFFAYMNLALVFIITFVIALWRWW